MPYYRITVGERQVVVEDKRTLQEVGESYKERLIGECDQHGHLMVPYITPEVEAILQNMQFGRSKPTASGGVIAPIHAYRGLAVMYPELFEPKQESTTVQESIDNQEADTMSDKFLMIDEFRAQHPGEDYRQYILSKINDGAFLHVTDPDTLTEIINTLAYKPVDILLDPNDPNPLGNNDEATKVVRKHVIDKLDAWWYNVSEHYDILVNHGTRRAQFIAKQYQRHRKYVKNILLEIIDPTDTVDSIRIDTTEIGTFNLLGEDAKGNWIRPMGLTYKPNGNFELFEDLE